MRQVPVNPKRLYSSAEHVCWTHVKQVPEINQLQSQQEIYRHIN